MLKFILPKPLFLRKNGKRGFGGVLWGGRESKNMDGWVEDSIILEKIWTTLHRYRETTTLEDPEDTYALSKGQDP